jgi:shikimate dehydrogenase
MPLKEQAAGLVDELDQAATAGGAVNCILRVEGKLLGSNTDLDGVAAAIRDTKLKHRKAVVVGGGGAARAALIALRRRGAALHLLVRAPQRAIALEALTPGLAVGPFDNAAQVIAGATLIINATPLGMTGSPEMPRAILDSLATAPDALAFDMVYRPIETPFLQTAKEDGLQTVDGLTMLIGQARSAFQCFFGAEPPTGDAELRAALIAQLRAG